MASSGCVIGEVGYKETRGGAAGEREGVKDENIGVDSVNV